MSDEGSTISVQHLSRLGSLVDPVEDLNGVVKRCWCDAQLAAEWMVEPENEEEQQAEQDRDRRRQNHVITSVI